MSKLRRSFNLVIENLIFSSQIDWVVRREVSKFQSRNRESYLFKFRFLAMLRTSLRGFNLVIENLIFSRISMAGMPGLASMFQSRNRESYLFKGGRVGVPLRGIPKVSIS